MPNKYDLTILNCAHSIYNLFEAEIDILKPNSYKLKQRLREYVNGNLYPTKKIVITSYSYYSKLQNYYQLKLNGIDFENLNLKSKYSYAEIEKIEELILNSGLVEGKFNLEGIFKQLFDHSFLAFINVILKDDIENPKYEKSRTLLQEIQKNINTIQELNIIENKELYFTFLNLLLSDYGVLYIEDILNHHLNKTADKNEFVKSLTKHILLIPEPLQDDEILNQINLWIKSNQDSDGVLKIETKANKLKSGLAKYGFFELPNVKQLSEPNKQTLVELISKNPMPYGIAMFDFLGFCEYLDREQGTKYKADNILSKLYNENAKDGTSAKHYRRSLIKPLTRYKSGEYKETVKTDYQKLK